ncbi:hypothetical protein F8154_06265 [Alkaliphilus pronyensis]|uniref:Uncharacterized protein n=1 Tax=Alkaliphilus pronyensis TaxID=1482732 RepID=A0A6I0F0F8_9FIRM|nr:hypothetical protein [Alkaliphilus pronyensis]KAB3535387.1 hypothetical protein F8154_06265 [Alkaliphilus pronyensis]
MYTFKVTDDEDLIAISFYNKDRSIDRLKLVDTEGTIQKEYSIEDFYKNDDSDEKMNIYINDFSIDNSVLWGGIGGDLDVFLQFIIHLEDGRIEIIDYNKYEEYIQKYPYVN